MNRILLSLFVAGVFCFISCGENTKKGEEQQKQVEMDAMKAPDSLVEKAETHCPFENAWYEIKPIGATSMNDIEEKKDIRSKKLDEGSGMFFFQEADGGGLFLALSSQGKSSSMVFKLNAPLTRLDNGTYAADAVQIKSKEEYTLMFDGDYTLALVDKKGIMMLLYVDMDSYKTLTDEMVDQLRSDLNK